MAPVSDNEANKIASKYNLYFKKKPQDSSQTQYNNKTRNTENDFDDIKVVLRCIFACLVNYRTEQYEQPGHEGLDYQALMQMPYTRRFVKTSIDKEDPIYETLKQWDMNSRGAKLKSPEAFRNTLMLNIKEITALQNYRLLDFLDVDKTSVIQNILSRLFQKLDLTDKKNENSPKTLNRFVTVSKTLHFLVPQLMIPMDRTYTANYFHNYTNPDLPSNEHYDTQVKWSIQFHQSLARVYKLHEDTINEISISTLYPVTKLLDNMLIGFCMFRNNYISHFDVTRDILAVDIF